MLQEERDRLSVEAGVLPVLLNDSLNEESDVELVLEVLLIELVTGGVGIVSVLVVIVLLLAGCLNSLVILALKVLLKNWGVFGEKLGSAIAHLLLNLEVTKSSTANVVVLEKLSVGELDHLFKALEGKLTHSIQVVLVLASSHGIDVTLNMVERLEGLSKLVASQVGFGRVGFKPHSLYFVDSCLVTTCFEEDVHGGFRLIDHINFAHLFGTQSVEGSVGLIENARFFE
jgi:hypothetical protein